MRFFVLSLVLIWLAGCAPPESKLTGSNLNSGIKVTSTNTDGMSVFEFEGIRAGNLSMGKWAVWSSLYGAGMQRQYQGDQIRVIYVPPSSVTFHRELLYISSDSLKISFNATSNQGVIEVRDNSDFYYKNKMTKAEFIGKVQSIVKILLSRNSS